jgi:hypothetical protein
MEFLTFYYNDINDDNIKIKIEDVEKTKIQFEILTNYRYVESMIDILVISRNIQKCIDKLQLLSNKNTFYTFINIYVNYFKEIIDKHSIDEIAYIDDFTNDIKIFFNCILKIVKGKVRRNESEIQSIKEIYKKVCKKFIIEGEGYTQDHENAFKIRQLE